MKKLSISILAVLAAIAVQAQTLNVRQGQVTYAFTADQAGTMTYDANGTTLTVGGKTFSTAEIDRLEVNTDAVSDNEVTVSYDGTAATVVIPGNVAPYVSATVSGAHVNISQTNTDAIDGGEVAYTLRGSSADGEFYLSGSYKCTVNLDGLTLTNATPVSSGAALHIQNGKRVKISIKEGTTNVLTDAAGGDQKGCLYVKGHAELKGKGTLEVYGRTKHGIKTGEYFSMKNATVRVLGAVGDGVSCNEYFLMESGQLSISGVGDDGIQCDLDGTASTGQTTGHEDEDSGNFYMEGGTIDVSVTATAAKAIKSDGDMVVSGGTIGASTSGGGEWDTTDRKTKASTCMSADGNIAIGGGSLTLASTGAGGKGISGDGTLDVTGGTLSITTTGGMVVYSGSTLYNGNYSGSVDRLASDYKSSPKGIKCDGDINISGGDITVSTSGKGGEGIESKNVLTISDGTVYASAYDDAINSSSHLYVKGGTVTAISADNDGLDSNGNLYVQGGITVAMGARQPECGIDANEEQNFTVIFTGGSLIGIGGGNSTPTTSASTQPYVTTSGSGTANSTVRLMNGSTELASFTIPRAYSSSSIIVTVPGMTSGSSYTLNLGSTSKSVTAQQYGKSSGPGGGGPGGGGPGGGGWW